MSDSFYKAFEDRHRGSRELIKGRLRIYLPFLDVLKKVYKPCSAIDLGCGRGEWLELLHENQLEAQGVDLSKDMLEACRGYNLKVQQEDAVSFIRRRPDDSEAIISGFHIAEHLPFTELRVLVTEALRVLKPAGLLILETPNPENLVVGASTFYLDPTHNRPLPPDLLKFLAEYVGFKRTKVVRLNEPSVLGAGNAASLATVIMGVSPDYAIVAQKAASWEVLRAFDSLFDKHYGVTLHETLVQYEESLGYKLDTILSELRTEREASNEIKQELATVYASVSWRITWPFRKLLRLFDWLLILPRKLISSLHELPRCLIRQVMGAAMRFMAARPNLSTRWSGYLDRYPRIKGRLRRLAANRQNVGLALDSDEELGSIPEIEHLSRQAKRVYLDLKKVQEEQGWKDV